MMEFINLWWKAAFAVFYLLGIAFVWVAARAHMRLTVRNLELRCQHALQERTLKRYKMGKLQAHHLRAWYDIEGEIAERDRAVHGMERNILRFRDPLDIYSPAEKTYLDRKVRGRKPKRVKETIDSEARRFRSRIKYGKAPSMYRKVYFKIKSVTVN